MTPQEEKLVLELHSKWGNRWSRIARKLPGRTDNEIKNYWRTHMRKKAQERKHAVSRSSSSSDCSSASGNPTTHSTPSAEIGEESFYDTGGKTPPSTEMKTNELEKSEDGYSMDDIWKEIALSEDNYITPVYGGYSEEGCSFTCPSVASPSWEYSSDTLWQMDEEEAKLFPYVNNQPFSFHDI